MRRMLDPKEVGGGSVKQYCHFIRFSPNDGGEICFNYTSTDETKLTKETIAPALIGKKLICTGYVKINDAAKTIQYVYGFNDGFHDVVSVKWIDLTTLANSTKEINISYISDKVFPIS